MRKLLVRMMVFLILASLAFASTVAQAPKPKRINRAIELLSQGQPIYYTGSHSGTDGNFEQGKKDAQTYADYISYDMEHAPFDVKGLADYMSHHAGTTWTHGMCPDCYYKLLNETTH